MTGCAHARGGIHSSRAVTRPRSRETTRARPGAERTGRTRPMTAPSSGFPDSKDTGRAELTQVLQHSLVHGSRGPAHPPGDDHVQPDVLRLGGARTPRRARRVVDAADRTITGLCSAVGGRRRRSGGRARGRSAIGRVSGRGTGTGAAPIPPIGTRATAPRGSYYRRARIAWRRLPTAPSIRTEDT